jgi:DNA mismatch repair protein MutS
MAGLMPRIKNYHVSVKEIQNKVIFLRKLLPGGSEHSFGIHVAKMAGMPQTVLDRAGEMLHQLEESHKAEGLGQLGHENNAGVPGKQGLRRKSAGGTRLTDHSPGLQLSFIQLDDPLLQQIKEDILNTEINTLTPVEALMKLNEIKKLLKKS